MIGEDELRSKAQKKQIPKAHSMLYARVPSDRICNMRGTTLILSETLREEDLGHESFKSDKECEKEQPMEAWSQVGAMAEEGIEGEGKPQRLCADSTRGRPSRVGRRVVRAHHA